MAAADVGIREIVTGRLPADRWQEPGPDRPRKRRGAWPEPGREDGDLHGEMREQVTGLLERWLRLAARYGELGDGREHERDRGVATAGLMRMGAVIYETCAHDLAGLLAGLDGRLPGGYVRRGPGGCGTDRESAA